MPGEQSGSARTTEGNRYATLVGDVAASRTYPDQKRLFSALRQIFDGVNRQVEAAQPIRFSVGDEFQAAYSTLADAIRATVLLRLRFKAEELGTFGGRDQDLRIGLAYGEIAVFDATEEPFGQSGTGWWRARSAIEKAERRKKGHGLPYSTQSSFAGEENELFVMTNAFLLALDQVMFRMDEKDVRITLGTLGGKTQKAIGEELEIGQSTISKRFKNNGPATILMILDTLGHTES